MGDLTRTFGGLIILAHRVNSQSLYVIASIYTYILDMYVYKYIITYILYYIIIYYYDDDDKWKWKWNIK